MNLTTQVKVFFIHYLYDQICNEINLIILKQKQYAMETKSAIRSFMTIILATLFISLSGQNYCYNYSITGGKKQYKYSDNFSNYDIQVNGEISVNDNDTGIKRISPGGSLKISKKTFGNKRSIIIESNSSGNLNYEYYEGRQEIPFDPEGKKWLADVLLDVVRLTGIDAEGRTKRIYAKEGLDGVIEEIHEISSNTVMAVYFESLLKNISLNDDEIVTVCSAISHEITSNTERGRLYRKYADIFMRNNTTAIVFFESLSSLSSNTERGSVLTSINSKIDFNDPKVTEAYFAGVDRMTSNTERGNVLRYTERNQVLSNNAYARLLTSVKKLSSNTEMGSVIRSLSQLDMKNPEVSTAYFIAIDAMTSNTEAGSTMRNLLKTQELGDDNYIRLLGSIKKLTSNTEMGSILRSIAVINLNNPQIAEAYFLAIGSMTSNTETGSVLRNTLREFELNTDSWSRFFIVTGKLTSNTEMGSVLSAASKKMPYDDEIVLDDFFVTANKFSSSTEHARVLRGVISNPEFNKYAAYKLLESTRKISSNTEKGSVLIKVSESEQIKDPEIRKIYMSTAQTLTSDSEYRRVVDKLME